MLVACMAGPIDTGQQIATYLFFHIIPIIIYHLSFHVVPEDPTSLRILTKKLAKTSVWRLRGHPCGIRPKNIKDFKKPKKKLISEIKDTTTIKQKLPAYLVSALFAALKVGCRIKAKLRRFLRPFQQAPRFFDDPAVRFDSDSFSIGMDNHASRCMATAPHLFEDLHLTNNAGEVNEQLALNEEIPKKLAKITPPKCAGCLFGAMTRIPWRGKEPQIDDSSAETITAKRAFETFAAERGVKILHYHCDNGRFQDNAFRQACHDARQQLTFCGVNAHFQNGIAECSIRDLSESARKQLLHARARWPQAVHLALWPYALRNAALLHNTLPVLEDDTSRLELFSSIHVGSNMRHVHTFGCPVFALQNALASGKSLPRWSPRACIGLNLGLSPTHARIVYLVLNLNTGCVSPQYHCRFDDFFETTRHGGPDVSGTISWQQLAGLGRASTILSEVSAPILHNVMYPETPSEGDVPPKESSFSPPVFDVTSDYYSISDRDSHVTGNSEPSRLSQAEGVTPAATPVTAGTSLRGRVRTRDSSRYSLLIQKTRLLTYSPSLWHKMTSNVIVALCAASNLPQATKVRECYENRVL